MRFTQDHQWLERDGELVTLGVTAYAAEQKRRDRLAQSVGAAQRALAEAAERRRLAELAATAESPREINGREGPDPVRYGDWEIKGLACDF